ncbi:uncharacterized protein LOC127873189 [Dreissena polymorpha]|uniref:Uncharacterized protein n=1 Tax=Dreissena polymorpha TaxID=45954 RepID=A0A9D4QW98_DREPO|nr:uncharacterized protein LOC127873189 [Dreissena polymorpha]XP_052272884.1 uncharacterized protein LOC127873189 [Dreissena polymorpha]KAH3846001.1 hypothetical protein DPMN_088296 [Dreissena polymorpha]
MQGKMSDTNIRYFVAISENKRKQNELRYQESKIDDLKKKMLSKYWKDKFSVFDEMIRLNVKTPSYSEERVNAYVTNDGKMTPSDKSMTLGAMAIDSKLLSNRPVTLQKNLKPGTRIEPIISIEGSDAVCYPNKEAKRGRKVLLNQRVLRRIEQCKALEESIASSRCKSARRDVSDVMYRRNGSQVRRPKTAPALKPKSDSDVSNDEPPSSQDAKDVNVNVSTRRPSTSVSSYRREGLITSIQRRPSTSLS